MCQAVTPAIVFVVTCPQCKREQLQHGFTITDLMGSLYDGAPIDAHCGSCEQVWAISRQKRSELGEVVAAVSGLAIPPAAREPSAF
jgi:hypothetical protein